jgi:hypothetical protein
VSVVNEKRVELAIGPLLEQSLSMVCVTGTNVDQPRKPEGPGVANAPEAASWQYLEQAFSFCTEKSGAKAPPGTWDQRRCGHGKPAARVFFNEGICYP